MNTRTLLLCSKIGIACCSCSANAADFAFDSAAIENTGQTKASSVDLSQFNGAAPPGKYYVTVLVNNKLAKKTELLFVADKEGKLVPQLSLEQLHSFGLYFNDENKIQKGNVNVSAELAGASTRFNFNKQLLEINIPQAYLKPGPDADLEIPSTQWDEGISAFVLNYDVNGAQKKENGGGFAPDDQFISLNGGINIGAWRFRDISTLDKPEAGPSTWDTQQVWLQRDIPLLRSLLSLGDNSSDGSLFDSVAFRGVSLATENEMYSDRSQGYAPVIRGIARTSNARVEISQNGNVIYKRYVPAGPFEITDLYQQSGGGELRVSVTEADGSEHHFIQPWGVVAAMQRTGHLKYSLNIGRSNNDNANNQKMTQLTLFYGLPYETTVFGGGLYAQNYQAIDLGYALGLGIFGSLSADITKMQSSSMDSTPSRGENYRLQYTKNVVDTDTDISVAWSVAPGKSYIAFPDAIQRVTKDSNERYTANYQKNKLQVTVNQSIEGAGTFALSAWRAEYWNQSTEKSLSLSDNLNIGAISVSLGWAWSQDENRRSDQQLAINVQIPFSLFSHNDWVSFANNLERPGTPSQTVGINGSALKDDALTWALNATNGDRAAEEQDLNLDYKSERGEYLFNYRHATQNQSVSYEAKGSMLASAYGVTFGQPFDARDSIALVRASGAAGLDIVNNPGVETDARGYAIVPYLQPYREDTVSLEDSGQGNEIELGNHSDRVVPTEEAVVVAGFSPHVGEKILAFLRAPDGSMLPFGATATAGKNSSEGIIDDTGKVYIAGAPEKGRILVKWGNPQHECHAPYTLKHKPGKHLYEVQLVCS